MVMPILFYGEDCETIAIAMRKEAVDILGLKIPEQLLYNGDYQEVVPTSKSYLHSMEAIQSLVRESALPPLNGDKRIIAILAADRMLPVHANALLKTLEDAPSYLQIMLVTAKYDDIIKTILSRVQKKHVAGAGELPDYVAKIEEIFKLLMDERFDSFLKSLDEVDKSIIENIETAEKKLRHFLETFSYICMKKTNQSIFISRVNEMVNISLKGFLGNIRIKHVLENLFLKTQQLHHSR